MFLMWGCKVSEPPADSDAPADTEAPADTDREEDQPFAHAIAASASGTPEATVLAVTIRSDDLDCSRYADWWEVVGADGSLVYRRILDHSHPDEQPFTRSGEPFALDPTAELHIRAHHHPGGYGGDALRGSVEAGFSPASWPDGLGAGLEDDPPLPTECRF